MLYFLACLICVALGFCLGLVAAFSGLIHHTPETLKPLDPSMQAFKKYTKGDKK